MSNSANHIAIPDLLLVFIPLLLVLGIYVKWSLGFKNLIYAVLRMTSQLIIIGYVLIIIFNNTDIFLSSLILIFMLLVSGWIALRPLKGLRRDLYGKTLLSLFLGCVPVLALVVSMVIKLSPWYMPRYLIPISGMIFANGMNSVSLCAERFHSEEEEGTPYVEARKKSYLAGLLPLTNSFFAVGLVSIPGMMTGQILAGTSPLLAVRYQIMVMSMLFSACGLSCAFFIYFTKDRKRSSNA